MKKSNINPILKVTVSFLILSLALLPPGISQSIITKHVITGQFVKHTIDKLDVLRPINYNKAVNDQLGVIGNDFYGMEYISGQAKGKSLKVGPWEWKEEWYPIFVPNIFSRKKATICGNLTNLIRRTTRLPGAVLPSDERADQLNLDNDYNFNVEPLFASKKISDDAESIQKSANHGEVEGEIDIDRSQWSSFKKYSSLFPYPGLSKVAMYGPFVHDSHSTPYLEIHPTEQLWWTYKASDKLIYNLTSFQDQSGRFEHTPEHTSEHTPPWEVTPLNGIFALAFDIIPGKEKLDYNILIKNKFNAQPIDQRIKKHFLIYRKDTLCSININSDPELISLSFEDLGYEVPPQFQASSIDGKTLMVKKDSVIKGFLVIKNRLNNNGTMLIQVQSQKQSSVPVSFLANNRVKITLESIKCLSVDDDSPDEDLIGYIGAYALEPYLLPAGIPHYDVHSPLLWSALDGANNDVPIKEGETKTYNTVKEFILSNDATIILKANLDENDSDDDGNETELDNAQWDDKLIDDANRSYNPWAGDHRGMKTDDRYLVEPYIDKDNDKSNPFGIVTMQVKDIPVNQPIKSHFRFYSGGSNVWVNYKIERTEMPRAQSGSYILIKSKD